MELKTYFAQDRNGSLIPSASVAIYLTGTSTLASGLTNVSNAPLSNPFTADADGKIQFHAPDGIYDMQVSLGSTSGIKVTFQCIDVEQQLADANSAAGQAELARDEAQAAASSIAGQSAITTANTREHWRREMADIGLTLVAGSFEDGAALSGTTDAIWYVAGGQCYTWGGSFNKDVPSNSTPSSTGGISSGAWVSASQNTFRAQLNAVGGATLIGCQHPLTGSIARTLASKNSEKLSVLDFGAKCDGVTDDTAAVQALLDAASDANTPAPTNKNYMIVFPSGVCKVSSLVVGRRTSLSFEGGRLEPLDKTTPRTHLIKFAGGYNKIYNLCINMDYAMNYDTVVWCRTRYIDFIAPEIWAAKCVWTFGDPAWKTDPVGGILGDSEIQIIGGWCNWCITHHRAYGVNTIVQFIGHECYSYKWSLPDGDPRKAAWEALPEITGYNCGAIIYLTGSFTGNYSGQQPNFLVQLQPTSTADYKNTYGRYMLSGTHIETGRLFQVEAAPSGYPAQDNYTQMLNVVNCTGYVSGGRSGYFIDCADALQSVNVINSNFYGNAVDKIVYALNSKVHVSRDSFPLITGGDIFSGLQARHFSNYATYNPFNVSKSTQSLSGLTTLKFTEPSPSDMDAAFVASYYSSSTGEFIIQQKMSNVEVDVALYPASPSPTDSTDIVLVINGAQAGVINSVGGTPRAIFKIKQVAAGSIIKIQAASYSSRTLDGSTNNRISISGSC